MSIRLQLLVVALTTLVLPWAGWQYARELEAALRGAQEQSLLASASTIANALSAQPQRVFRNPDARAFDARNGDLYVHPLQSQPLVDGYREDWGIPWEPVILPTVNGYRVRMQTGSTEHYLYLYAEVDDAHFDAEPNDVKTDDVRFDRIDVWLKHDDGTVANYFFATTAPGLTAAQYAAKDDDSDATHVASETRIQAYWLQTAQGYRLEARIPMSFVGNRLWIKARDGDGKGSAGYDPETNAEGGRLFFATEGLGDLLDIFIRDGTRATVVDDNALVLGSAGTVSAQAAGADDTRSLIRTWLETDASNLPPLTQPGEHFGGSTVQAALDAEPRTRWVRGDEGRPLLSAAAPIIVDASVRGAVVLEQNAEQMSSLREQAFTRLVSLTLIATATAMLIMLAFAAWITFRIGRLRNAADAAVGNDGSIRLTMPGAHSRDEIGALARAFERLLARLNEHTQYLRTLGGKLSHELRTPLTIVRSSLDNLETSGAQDEQHDYIARAREGTQRLQTILTSLGAAARVEESIKQAERTSFDLRDLIASTMSAYRDGFPETAFTQSLPDDPCPLRGAPDLIAQMLDKLIENAVDFCPAAGRIEVRLSREPGNYVLEVDNDGPRIGADVLPHLFESLYEQRSGRDDKPHFGLGLYIVRLIAEFHGGAARAANRVDGGGAVFSVVLPMI